MNPEEIINNPFLFLMIVIIVVVVVVG